MKMENMSGGSETVGSVILVKLFPALSGMAGAVVSFLFIKPKTTKEFGVRLICAGIGSHFFGDPMLRIVVQLFGHYVEKEEIRASVYLGTGGVFFFLLGAVFLFIDKRQDKDIKEIIQDTKL